LGYANAQRSHFALSCDKRIKFNWVGEFCFGESWAIFRGLSADNTLHEHAAIQLVFAEDDGTTIIDGESFEHGGSILSIRLLVLTGNIC
jgi:hypothetical protein